MTHLKLIAAAVMFAAASLAGAAEHKWGVSEADQTGRHVQLAPSLDKTHPGKAGLRVFDKDLTADNSANSKPVSFAKMKEMAHKWYVPGTVVGQDQNGVVTANLYRMSGFPWNAIPKMPDHSQLGRISFAQVGNEDVWFGDWSNVPAGAAVGAPGSNYTVYYSGTNPTDLNKMPTGGTATYSIKGINQHTQQGSPILQGTLTADFGSKKVNADLRRNDLGIRVREAKIDGNRFSGDRAATALDNKNRVLATGKVNGQFFGDKAAAVAGVADFGKNNRYNTSFGGTKK